MKKIFFDVQELLDRNRREARRYKYGYKLSKLVKCGECGQLLCGVTSTGRKREHFYYAHTRKYDVQGNIRKKCQLETVPAPQLESIVQERLKSAI